MLRILPQLRGLSQTWSSLHAHMMLNLLLENGDKARQGSGADADAEAVELGHFAWPMRTLARTALSSHAMPACPALP